MRRKIRKFAENKKTDNQRTRKKQTIREFKNRGHLIPCGLWIVGERGPIFVFSYNRCEFTDHNENTIVTFKHHITDKNPLLVQLPLSDTLDLPFMLNTDIKLEISIIPHVGPHPERTHNFFSLLDRHGFLEVEYCLLPVSWSSKWTGGEHHLLVTVSEENIEVGH